MNNWDITQAASLPMPAFATSHGRLIFANASAAEVGICWPGDRGRPVGDFLRAVDGRQLFGSDGLSGVLAEAAVNSADPRRYFELRSMEIQVDGVGAELIFCWNVTERVHNERELRYNADHDALTGLLRRNAFLDRATRALSMASSRNQVALLLADLDDFKSINDVFGHLIGDEVLAASGRRLRSAVRGRDLVARFGGDEFLVLANGLSTHDDAAALVERIHRAFEAPVRTIGGDHISVNMSIGVAMQSAPATGEGTPAERLLAVADTEVLRRKRSNADRKRQG
jgi:diguanylate cyclase (GGDEF)-like protein